MSAIIKKELKNYFLSPIGYIVLGVFLALFSLFFYITTVGSSSIDLTNLFWCVAYYGGLSIIIPLITMWSISGERKNGTDQLIMTVPVSMSSVVIAKFIASLLFIIIPLLCTGIYFGIISYFQMPDIPTYLTSILGFLLLSMAYISFGIFASSLTDSPIISAILSFGLVSATTWLPSMIYSFTGTDISGISMLNLFINFLFGKIDIFSLVALCSITLLFLILTIIVMQRRKSVI